jgi:NADPH:quinone reductase-like Zn-dependent oxidoreductase
MRAIVHDPEAPHGLRLTEVPRPRPGPGQVLVRVAAASLNFADVAYLADRGVPGAVPGFDAAGVVEAGDPNGSGPPPGSRVVTFDWAGAWAERRVVDVGELAIVPDGVDLVAAAAVPVAGVTALRALRTFGPLAGRRILVTGASGGVGRFAVQLAAREGAHVIASVGHPERGARLGALGAGDVVVGLDGIDAPIDGAVDNVGGATLAGAFALLAPGGTVASVGMASGEATTIDFEQARLRGGGSRIEVFAVGAGFGPDLAILVGLVAAGELDPQVDWRGPWDKVGEAAGALLGRTVRGKAILEVPS